ncbi:Phyhd1 [Symbiodinium microadriaticum]|nr:Phyhd1 [Symbiodinium microadriaticum]
MQGASDYFLDSADRIHFFIEKDAEDEDGKIKKSVSKARSLNKVGHGLHVADPVFREYSQSSKVAELVAELGWRDPVLPQSMYIFKQPATGSEVTSHQDSSFLYTTPRPTCMGLWLALDDATLENGCLWARHCVSCSLEERIFNFRGFSMQFLCPIPLRFISTPGFLTGGLARTKRLFEGSSHVSQKIVLGPLKVYSVYSTWV